MPGHSWKEIRGTAAPETLARAALKTEAILASMDQQDRTHSGSPNPDAVAEEAFPNEKNEPRL